MKSFINRLTVSMISVFIVFLAIVHSGDGIAQDAFTLAYKFRQGDTYTYRTEKHDSTVTELSGQSMSMNMTVWSLETLKVTESVPDKPFKIAIMSDSVWTDQENFNSGGGAVVVKRNAGNSGEGSRSVYVGNKGSEERAYEIHNNGKSADKASIMSPFILTLPDKPVRVNDVWEFNKTHEIKGRRKGTTQVSGQCTLYDIIESNGKSTARIIVNYELDQEMQFSFAVGENTIKGSNKTHTGGFSLVYFDIDRGIVCEVITEETSESVNESPTGSMQMSRFTKSEIKLQ